MQVLNNIKYYLFRGQVFCLSLFFLLLSGAEKAYSAQHNLDFIYIDSSVDEAAGGHAAMRFGQTVFHYQFYPEGYFLLVKDNWDEFRHQYNDVQNRTLAIGSIPLSLDTYQRVKNQFLSRYLLQEKRFAYLKQLEREKSFFQTLVLGEEKVEVRGLGFFSLDYEEAPACVFLREVIGDNLGHLYLKQQLQSIEIRLEKAGENLHPYVLKDVELEVYSSSFSFTSISRQYFELLELYQAFEILIYARPVLEDTLFHSASAVGQLDASELEKVKQFRQKLLFSITSLLESSRPGRGRALLLQIARFQAVQKTLESGYLITLDPFSEDAELLEVGELFAGSLSLQEDLEGSQSDRRFDTRNVFSSSKNYLEQLRNERISNVVVARDNFFSDSIQTDISYNQLEFSLGRLGEVDRAFISKDFIRVENGNQLPVKSRLIQVPDSLSRDEIVLSAEIATDNELVLKRKLLQVYDYNLFGRNCVTELFETVYSGFSSIEQVEHELGGYLEPGEQLSFVPFLAFAALQSSFSVASVEVLPSFRKRKVSELYEKYGMWRLFKESNTMTSSVYLSWKKDSTFLFFTDDVFLFRPVFGTINLLYAAFSSLGGFVWFPVDDGELLNRSLRGMVFSLPELAFFNIRKGTFPVVP